MAWWVIPTVLTSETKAAVLLVRKASADLAGNHRANSTLIFFFFFFIDIFKYIVYNMLAELFKLHAGIVV